MKRHIVNHRTYAEGCGNPSGEENLLPSMTVPDQSLSLKDLLSRYVRSGLLEQRADAVYLGEDDLIPDNLERLDPMEIADLSLDMKQHVEDRRNRLPKAALHPQPELVPVE